MRDALAEGFAAWAESLRWEAMPAEAQAMVRKELLDYVGCLVAGYALAGGEPWLDVFSGWGGKPEASVAGGVRLPAPAAALINGYFGHVLEFDDTHDEAVLHAGASVIPAAMAACERWGPVSGRQFLEAVALGLEITCRLGVACRRNVAESGWIYTPLLGGFGAAAAAAWVAARDPDLARRALGIVYSRAAGNHQTTREGSPLKHLQPGFAAESGVIAAALAEAGLAGVQAPFLGEDGFARVYLGGSFDPERALAGLGSVYELNRLSFKPYPTCRLTHPAITAALLLRERLGGEAVTTLPIEAVHVHLGAQAADIVGRDEPFRRYPVERVPAQFSIYWTVAVALLRGRVTPVELARDIPPRSDVAALIERIRCRAMDGDGATRDVGGCVLEVRLPSGTEAVRVEHARGHPDDPFTDADLWAKFEANLQAAGATGPEAAHFGRLIAELETRPDARVLPEAVAALTARWRGEAGERAGRPRRD
ncbi:MAG TPA: MmgE/PrpD family protein [Limnochordales bacterium]